MPNPDNVVRKIYVASEALWDLRQGTLAFIDTDFAVGVTSQESYYTRDEDVFSYNGETLRKDIYEGVYRKYPQEILRLSLRTMIFDFLRDLCKEFIKHSAVTPFLDDFAVQLNTYPFQLNEEEKSIIQEAMRGELGQGIAVEVVYLPLRDLTPDYVKQNYSTMVLYHYYEWLNQHVEAFKKTPLLDVGLYVPRIFFLDKTTIPEDFNRDMQKYNTDAFQEWEKLWRSFFILQHLPISHFSAATPVNVPRFRQLVRAER